MAPDDSGTIQTDPTNLVQESTLEQQQGSLDSTPDVREPPGGGTCQNYSTFVGAKIGCCTATATRNRRWICLYGQWYPNGSVCTYPTSYCVCPTPGQTSCGS
jgi:hypothetical protein